MEIGETTGSVDGDVLAVSPFVIIAGCRRAWPRDFFLAHPVVKRSSARKLENDANVVGTYMRVLSVPGVEECCE